MFKGHDIAKGAERVEQNDKIRCRGTIAVLALLALLAGCTADQAHEASQSAGRVLIIGLDGTRSEAIELASTPALDQLRLNGYTDLDAITGDISLSGPGWSSLLTGVWCTKHGVLDNDSSWSLSRFDQYPHLFHRVEAAQPSLFTASIVQWNPINDEILCAPESGGCGAVDLVVNADSDEEVKSRAVELLGNGDPHALFVQFDDVDHVGHGTSPGSLPGGFCPFPDGTSDGACTLAGENPAYAQRVSITDGYIGEIIAAMKARPGYEQENWLVLVSPDHGGGGTLVNQHGFPNSQDRRTFFIVAGAAAQPLPEPYVSSLAALPGNAPVYLPTPELPAPSTLGVKIVDIAATALAHLGVALEPEWALDGQAAGLSNAPVYEERAVPSCFEAPAASATAVKHLH